MLSELDKMAKVRVGCGNLALQGLPGPAAAPTEMPVACRQQPAGGELGLAICSPPGSFMFMREKGENVQFYTSLPRPVSSTQTISLPIAFAQKRRHTLWNTTVKAQPRR